MVFQSYAIWPHMSVIENVAYALEGQRMSKAERRKRAMAAPEAVKLAHLAERPAPRLSGGQQQRVAIARAMVANPKVILADEPTGNLDTANGDAVMNLLMDVSKSGTTVVMVTHSLAYAGFAQRTIKLLDGRVVSETLLAA
jgi:putative ABC transport system ATP-binding protein